MADDDDEEEDGEGHSIKYIDALLGPDPACDPYPRYQYRTRKSLFYKKYADDFFREYPGLKEVKFADLISEHADNPIIQRVTKEFPPINKAYRARVAEWREKWPEFAKKVDSTRGRLTVQRKERKYNNKNKNDPDVAPTETTHPRNLKRPHTSVATEVGVLSEETMHTLIKMQRMAYEKSSALLAGQNMILDHIHGEYAKRMRELEYERQYIN